jgi:baculoviral IAP repeat-containing protein 6
MQPYRFIEADLLSAGHYFARDAAAATKSSAWGEVMRRRLKRITEELGVLSTSLPLSWDSSILLAVHTDRLDVLRAALLPHPDTPYGGGAFLFDILLPPEYPDKPPRVQFLTTGGGNWRANPNLYACGKVGGAFFFGEEGLLLGVLSLMMRSGATTSVLLQLQP